MALAPLAYERLLPAHVDELAAVLRNDDVYRHIGGTPSLEGFRLRMLRALEGPPPGRQDQRWINYLVRLAATGEAIGRLEATVIGANAEVAFLFDPARWGQGHASRSLQWFHEQLRVDAGDVQCWATTMAHNTRCRALLERGGYVQVSPASAPRLVSYDDGDLVFRRSTRASNASNPG
jgi:RimJ/RimL family protein N-acetyltransferase